MVILAIYIPFHIFRLIPSKWPNSHEIQNKPGVKSPGNSFSPMLVYKPDHPKQSTTYTFTHMFI